MRRSITVAGQRRICTVLSPLPLAAAPHENQLELINITQLLNSGWYRAQHLGLQTVGCRGWCRAEHLGLQTVGYRGWCKGLHSGLRRGLYSGRS